MKSKKIKVHTQQTLALKLNASQQSAAASTAAQWARGGFAVA
jgi:hypothetical protein